MPTLIEFLLKETQDRELCVITVAGKVQAMVHIDHEDRLIYALPDKLLNRTVKSDHWDTFFPIVNASGQAVPTPVHYIEVGD